MYNLMNHAWIQFSDFLFPEELHYLIYNWSNGHEWEILQGNDIADAAHRFLSIDSRDLFRSKIARDVASARHNGVVPKRLSIVNTGTSDLTGFH